MEPSEAVIVRVPNIFANPFFDTLDLNPAWEGPRAESLAWAASYEFIRTSVNFDMAYFWAIVAPRASQETLRVLFDWGNLIFTIDDMLDLEGLKDRPAQASALINAITSVQNYEDPSVENFEPKQNALVRAYIDFWTRLSAALPDNHRNGFADAMARYFIGAYSEVQDNAENKIPLLEDMLRARYGSIAILPILELLKYVNEIDLLPEKYQEPLLQRIEALCVETVIIQNDVISYYKEERAGNTSGNLIASLRLRGLTAQEAFDKAGEMLCERYNEWTNVVAQLATKAEYLQAGEQVDKWIKTAKSVVRGVIQWSFHVPRYFSPHEKRNFLHMGQIKIEKYPRFLRKEEECLHN